MGLVGVKMVNELVIHDVFEKSGKDKGLYIVFYSDETCHIDDIFTLFYDGADRYFIITNVRTDIGRLYVKAKEYGYYDLMFRKIDIRRLMSSNVTIVTDKEVINKLHKQACYL